MNVAYFWEDGVLFTDGAQEEEHYDCFCVDTRYLDIESRYGFYNMEQQWVHVPKKMFPAEFLTHLLLLEVS